MAIPPIISNNPLLKLFRINQQGDTGAAKAAANAARAQTPQDIVEISQAAQQRLDGVRILRADSPGEVRGVATDTGGILRDDETLTLGLDPAISQ